MRRSKILRGVLGFLAVVFFGVFALVGVLYLRAEKPVRPTGDNPVAADLAGQSCDYWRDPESRIPHVKGQGELGAVACLGYANALDRMWQMDYLRRLSQGRSAEVIGGRGIQGDFFIRMLGLRKRAEKIFAAMDPKSSRRYWAYAYGVNQALKQQEVRDAYEFKKYGYEPEPWHPVDSVSIVLVQSFDQTRRSLEVHLREDVSARAKPDESVGAMPPYTEELVPWATTVLKAGEYTARDQKNTVKGSASSGVDSGMERTGSNNWVVAASRTSGGNAFFANDPHLELHYPPIWHWVSFSGGPIEAMGASLPGVPLVVSGGNQNLAWGLTNSYLDVMRVYHVLKSELKDAPVIRPVIWFKAGPIHLPYFFTTFQETSQGYPVLPIPAPEGKAKVLYWSTLDTVPTDFTALFDIMAAGSVDDADRIFAQVLLPSWNFVFADTKGDIGYRAVGHIPKELRPLPRLVEDRAEGAIRPTEFLTPAEMPHLLRPARGYIATANNRHWPEDSANFGGRSYSQSFRAFRIEELLKASTKHDLQSIRGVQCDQQSVDARFLLPLLLSQVEVGNISPIALRTFQSWEKTGYDTGLDCRACAVYRRWIDLVRERQGVPETDLYLGLKAGLPALKAAFKETLPLALADLKVKPGDELPELRSFQVAPFHHFSGDAFERLPGDEAIESPSGRFSVNYAGTEWEGGRFEVKDGPSQRLIVEMSRPPRFYSDLPGSEEDLNHPGIGKPDSEWRRWAGCEHRPRPFPLDWAKVKSTRLPL